MSNFKQSTDKDILARQSTLQNDINTKKTDSNTQIANALDYADSAIFGNVVALTGTNINLAQGNIFTKTISSNTTFTITYPSKTRKGTTFSLILTNAGSYTITWPSSVKWSQSTKPQLSTGLDILTFITANGGSTWYGAISVLKAG